MALSRTPRRSSSSPRPQSLGWAAAGILALGALVILLERLHTFAEPLERDITTYAVIAHEMLGGRSLYSDLWDCKPPLLYLTYAGAECLAGYGPSSIFLLNLLASLATLVGVFLAGRWGGGTRGGFWAALSWAVLSGDLYLQANQPNIEVFLNALLIFAFLSLSRIDRSSFRPVPVFVLGILLTLATLYKQVAVLPFLAGALVYGLSAKGGRERRVALAQVGTTSLVLLLGWALVAGYFVLQGHFDDFKYSVFDFNYYFSNYRSGSWLGFLAGISALPFPFTATAVLGVLLLLACSGAYRERKDPKRPWPLWLGFLLTLLGMVVLPMRFHPHYFQLLLPALVVGAAWAVEGWGRTDPRRWFLGGAVLLGLILYEAPFYRLSPQEWSLRKYGDEFVASYLLGDGVEKLLAPGETFYEWGSETSLYFTTRRHPPSGLFFSIPLLNAPPFERLNQRAIADLERSSPELFICNSVYMTASLASHPLILWFRERYRHVPGLGPYGPFLLFAKKGGALEKRLTYHGPNARRRTGHPRPNPRGL